jgi:xylan 1,4-beta-xylosidase
MIPKPTYWTFVFYKELYKNAVAKNENFVLTKSDDGNLKGIAWNPVVEEAGEDKEIALRLSVNVNDGTYFLLIKTVDETTCNPLKTWINMGCPAYPDKDQIGLLIESARPVISTKRIEVKKGEADIEINLTSNAVIYFELQKIKPETDRGFRAEEFI